MCDLYLHPVRSPLSEVQGWGVRSRFSVQPWAGVNIAGVWLLHSCISTTQLVGAHYCFQMHGGIQKT